MGRGSLRSDDLRPRGPRTDALLRRGRAETIASLSGGEAARVVFCRIPSKPNVLVLDEPTNHLDLESIAALTEALVAFEGTVVFVSDRHVVSKIATRVVEIKPDGINDFPGTYDEYLERSGDDHLDAATVVLRAKAAKATEASAAATSAASSGAAVGESWEEQKRRRNRQKDLPQRRDKVLAEASLAEARKKEIHDAYATPGFFETTPPETLKALEAEDLALGARIDTLMAEWETLEAEIAEISRA
ncbi:MAG: hypothetical protein U0169_23255 [Polyangiaceae bacterium]